MLIILGLAGGGVLAWYWRDRGQLARWLAVRLLAYSDELRARADLVEAWKHNVGYHNVKEGRCSMH